MEYSGTRIRMQQSELPRQSMKCDMPRECVYRNDGVCDDPQTAKRNSDSACHNMGNRKLYKFLTPNVKLRGEE